MIQTVIAKKVELVVSVEMADNGEIRSFFTKEQIKKMKIQKFLNPDVLVIDNFFGSNLSEEMFNDILLHQEFFIPSSLGSGDNGNSTNYFMPVDLTKNYVTKKFSPVKYGQQIQHDVFIRDLLLTCGIPSFNDFYKTNKMEIQINRYGHSESKFSSKRKKIGALYKDQSHDWHIDMISSDPMRREFTLSYYVFSTPKKFKGGDVVFSSAPFADNDLVQTQNDINQLTIEVKNDRAIIFSNTVPHKINPTESPENFEDGRFSIQFWLGRDG